MKRVRGWLAVSPLAALAVLAALGVSGCGSPGESGRGVAVSDSAARGCEVLLTEGSAKIDKVTFDESLVGSFVREAPRVAITFVAAKDAPIAQGAVKLSITGEAGQVQVKKVNCVNAKAAPLTGVAVTLN